MSLLLDYFERVAIISLAKHGARRECLAERLSRSGLIHANKICWVVAMDGLLLPPPAWWKTGPGAWGCLLSHARIMQDAIRDGLENVLILEDDVIFHTRTAEWLPSFMNAVPCDWGQLYLGGQHLQEPITTPSPLVLRATNINRTHAYALHRRAIPRIHQHIWHTPDFQAHPTYHIDHQYGHAHQRLLWHTYAPIWWMAGQDEGASDICHDTLNHRWWHQSNNAFLPVIYAPDLSLTPTARQRLWPISQAPRQRSLMEHLLQANTESLIANKLPLWQDAEISAEVLRQKWPGGILTPASLDAEDVALLADYPANSLFPHPHNTFRIPPWS